MAEWLRRLTRNQIPSGSVGSNPTDCVKYFFLPPAIPTIFYVLLALSRFTCEHRWFSGRMLACHAGGPGSIPGRCKLWLFFTKSFIYWNWLYQKSPKGTIFLQQANELTAKNNWLEVRGIDPRTSRMLSERSTIWATAPSHEGLFQSDDWVFSVRLPEFHPGWLL